MSLFDQFLRRAVVAACVALSAEAASAQPVSVPAPTPTSPAPAVAASSEPVIPASGIGRGPFGMRVAPVCPPSHPCPPVTPGTPGHLPPGVTPPVSPPVDPMNPNPPPAPAPAPAPDFSGFGDTAAGGGSSSAFAPNLFGDIFGSRSTQIRVPQSMPGFLNGKTVVVGVNNLSASGSGPITLNGNFSNGSLSIRDGTATQIVQLPGSVPTVNGIPITNPFPFSVARISGAFTETAPGVNQVYTSTGVGGATANYVIGYFAGTTGNPPPSGVPITIPSTIVPPGFGTTLVSQVEQAANPGTRVTQLMFGQVMAVYDGNELRYYSVITDTVSGPGMVINVPNPGSGGGGGGVVGIIKISEDNNPMPRDRVIFNYDYFSNVPFTASGIPVNRYQFGIEKTFLDGRASLEFRLPFASTLNSDGTIMGTGRNTEFGNLRLAAKALLVRRETVNVAAGLGVYLPTADDLNVRNMNGSNFISVQNSSVQLAPYAALLYTPNDRLFAQAWMGFTFDTGGNQVTVDPNMFGRSNIGNFRGATLWTIDAQVGYWIYQAESGFVRGLAPFVELHYNGTVSSGTVLNAGNGFFIGDTVGNSDELNMTAGVTTKLGDQSTLGVAMAAPLRTGQNRTFDYQIGVRFNYFFGYTARNQTRGTFVSTAGR